MQCHQQQKTESFDSKNYIQLDKDNIFNVSMKLVNLLTYM